MERMGVDRVAETLPLVGLLEVALVEVEQVVIEAADQD